jgi:hypothetical protein
MKLGVCMWIKDFIEKSNNKKIRLNAKNRKNKKLYIQL